MTTQQEQEQYLRRGRLLNQLERGNSISETDSAWFLGIAVYYLPVGWLLQAGEALGLLTIMQSNLHARQ